MPPKISVTFMVSVLLPDDTPETIASAQSDITQNLTNYGFTIAAVAPYERESLRQAGLDFPSQPDQIL